MYGVCVCVCVYIYIIIQNFHFGVFSFILHSDF